MKKAPQLPDLPFHAWTDTRLTLHLILQIIGKSRLKLTARKNHWWYITLYVTSRGFGTHSIPINDGQDSIDIEFDILKKEVVILCSTGTVMTISLESSPDIAAFYKQYMDALASLGLRPQFVAKPFDMGVEEPFEQLTMYHHYDWNFIHRFWKLMRWNNAIFKEFSGRFYGKTCPVQIYWHHLDLTVTRFSGKKLPKMDESARILEKDTYSHEQISFGFWAGDDNLQEPMYYSYTYPSPEGIDKEILQPEAAKWAESNGSPMALLRYEDVKNADNPAEAVLDFLESAYQAGAKHAGWNMEELKVPDIKQL
ncbi:DUF5996 family protein [Fulvivirga kasyanovii]|uniref:Ava_C0101 and related proteins n=1 Tax=Fulvivirga kasyanovii TaxID=396812 RepID=A0ABW9RLY3_9BACT|nr:DUF5996 family protein [Fulvivirga kasyanovii]MTI23910.1 hypothetical protein [Fulvivirga kasyanovii]